MTDAELEAVLRAEDERAKSVHREGMKQGVNMTLAFLDSEIEWYGNAHGQLDGIPFEHVTHICRVMKKRIRETILEKV